MVYHKLGLISAFGAIALLVACGDEIKAGAGGNGLTTGGGPNAGGGPASGGGDPAAGGCASVCCPADPSCYADAQRGQQSPGAECAATRDNTEREHIQLRQQWIRATRPRGNTIQAIYDVLAGRTQLPWPGCKQEGLVGSGGYIQLIDLFLPGGDERLEEHYSLTGYAEYVPASALEQTLTGGFCFGQTEYTADPGYALPSDELSPSTDYPPGLPAPMGLADAPWQVTPARAKRLREDFDLTTDRQLLLAMIDTELRPAGFNAVFYYDSETGYAHGFAPLSWTVVYNADGSDHIAIPIREAETRTLLNDPDEPNCVGGYRDVSLSVCTANDPTDPPWGCVDGSCPGGESPATTEGYFLISELEQIFVPDLMMTLCVSYPTRAQMEEEGFWNSESRSCRTAKWDPTDPTGNGLPRGDWCAATNSAASGTCHDAWKSLSFHVYAGAEIKTDMTCRF